MWQRFIAVGILLLGAAIGYFIWSTEASGDRFKFHLGLDLSGGTHLVYRADISGLSSEDVEPSLEALRAVIERRVNLFGVAEPLVQIERSSFVADPEQRLIIELPGITDVSEAIRLIGETPLLEFKLRDESVQIPLPGTPEFENFDIATAYKNTGLTGRLFERAQLQFGTGGAGLSNEPIVSIQFNNEGAALFEQITRENVGEELGIFLDGVLISSPVIQDAISGGTAVITGNFTPESGRELVKNLNFGALPVPISLISTQTIGATLGERAVEAGVLSSILGLGAVSLFMILWYRLPGLVSAIALLFYLLLMLVLFKLIPVTLTAAGLAGLVLSLGLAVDANILIAERLKEELRSGKSVQDAIKVGYARAWTSIRDGNIVNIISGIILYWFGDVFIEGFAFMLVLGTFISLFSAILVSRTLLLALGISKTTGIMSFLMKGGFRN